ncbi:hypothetical protein IEQ34_009188 [Dendrobium chrysotoxum]|uniref:Uncharacterized protein n=1 Tax=Dendrobium chrysotoxum TaxID=161865 RepID=A0AAV7H155_DENCH|nr:hypothetical protein IEQ34_009188 [Dendrobium chrysotoxum]
MKTSLWNSDERWRGESYVSEERAGSGNKSGVFTRNQNRVKGSRASELRCGSGGAGSVQVRIGPTGCRRVTRALARETIRVQTRAQDCGRVSATSSLCSHEHGNRRSRAGIQVTFGFQGQPQPNPILKMDKNLEPEPDPYGKQLADLVGHEANNVTERFAIAAKPLRAILPLRRIPRLFFILGQWLHGRRVIDQTPRLQEIKNPSYGSDVPNQPAPGFRESDLPRRVRSETSDNRIPVILVDARVLGRRPLIEKLRKDSLLCLMN